MGASGSFMSGMNTYMMALGPEKLKMQSFFSSDVDRQIAASSAGAYMRLRLQDIVNPTTCRRAYSAYGCIAKGC